MRGCFVVGIGIGAGCAGSTSTRLTVHGPELLADAVTFADHPGLVFTTDAAARGRGLHLVASEDGGLAPGAYRIDQDGREIEVTGGDALGMQFGVAAALEGMGFRFVHPTATLFPTEFSTLDPDTLALSSGRPTLGEVVEPETATNGLHLHTLHPIEAMFDLWEPDPDGLTRAKRLVDWTVKNRGNRIDWPALDNIVAFPGEYPAWRDHTAEIVRYAHARGVKVSLGVQLFGSGNLQHAFDLVDGAYDEAEVDARLALLAAVEPDGFDLSFGEFSGEDPAEFVDVANKVVARMKVALPDVAVNTVVHVGNYPDLRVVYEGEELLYYFLAKYIDGTTPLVHSVMYYNLFEDAGLAYLHDEFDEHRQFLLDRMRAGEPVGYYPESAYWVAFDDSVPLYLPVYLKSRFTDLSRIRDEGGALSSHVLFSSGWEWGYWQTDLLTLRMVDHLPEAWGDPVHELMAPWGDDGAILADAIVDLGELQHDALLVDRLAPYLAGRDAIIDLGDTLGIVSQPDRPQIDEVAGLDDVGKAQVAAAVAGLEALSLATTAIGEDIALVGGTHPVFDEVRDGVTIDTLRAAFAADVYGAALAAADGDTAGADAALASAEVHLGAAQGIVAHRKAALWWTGGDRIASQSDDNATIYQFGYLAKADALCYWTRELTEAHNAAHPESPEVVPPCT